MRRYTHYFANNQRKPFATSTADLWDIDLTAGKGALSMGEATMVIRAWNNVITKNGGLPRYRLDEETFIGNGTYLSYTFKCANCSATVTLTPQEYEEVCEAQQLKQETPCQPSNKK